MKSGLCGMALILLMAPLLRSPLNMDSTQVTVQKGFWLPDAMVQQLTGGSLNYPQLCFMEKPHVLKMLVIDDDPGFLGLIATALAHQDLHILAATDSEAGLELFLRMRPHIVITDVVMPKLDGLQF